MPKQDRRRRTTATGHPKIPHSPNPWVIIDLCDIQERFADVPGTTPTYWVTNFMLEMEGLKHIGVEFTQVETIDKKTTLIGCVFFRVGPRFSPDTTNNPKFELCRFTVTDGNCGPLNQYVKEKVVAPFKDYQKKQRAFNRYQNIQMNAGGRIPARFIDPDFYEQYETDDSES